MEALKYFSPNLFCFEQGAINLSEKPENQNGHNKKINFYFLKSKSDGKTKSD